MKNLRLTSFLLCALIILLSCPMTTVADDTVSASTSANETAQAENTTQSTLTQPTLPEEVLGPGELFYEDLQALRVEDVARPETVTLEMAQTAQHVNRLEEQETNLHTVIFQNRGGNKTAYVYSQPVKYVTAAGAVRDKDTAITETNLAGFAYAMTDNSITAHFASNTSGGVVIEFAGHGMRMIPEGSNLVSVATRGDGDNVILYNNAFGARTALRYQTQLNGVKEDIVLLQNVGKSSFRFLLTTDLTPTELNGAWVLTDEAGAVVMTLGEILVRDSAGKTAYGDLNITPRAQGGYLMTVTAPEAFLSAPDTVYPVYIDPTTTVDEIEYYETYEGSSTIYNEYDAIVDVGLYNSQTEYQVAIANTNYHRLSANGRVIYKLPDFYEDYGLFTDLDAKQVGKVTLYVQLGSGVSGNLATAMPTATWANTTVPTALYDTTLWGAQTVAFTDATAVAVASGEYAVDITKIARSWLNYNANGAGIAFQPQYGFSLLADFTSTRNVAAVEASASIGDVYYTVDYDYRGGLYYVQNIAVSKYLVKGNSTLLTVTADVTAVCAWTLDYQGDGKHIVYLGNDDSYILYALGRLFSMPDELSDTYMWTIASARTGGVIFTNAYTGKVLCYNGSSVTAVTARAHTDSTYTQTTWAIGRLMQSFTVINHSWIDVDETRPSTIAAIPSNSAFIANTYFTWSSSDTTVATVDASGNVTGEGAGYAYITATHFITAKTYSWMLIIGTPVEEGSYFLCVAETNKGNSRYLEIENAAISAPTPAQVNEFHAYEYSQWVLEQQTDGYYTIQAVHSELYLGVSENVTTGSMSVVQLSTPNNASARWAITFSPTYGNYILTSKACVSQQLVLGVPISESNTLAGTDVCQLTYTNDTELNDEWMFFKIGAVHPVELEGQEKGLWCWVTTARMFAKNYCDEIISTQTDAVLAIKGTDDDAAGTKDEAAEAINYFLNSSGSADLPLTIKHMEIYSADTVKSFLDDNHVIYISRGFYSQTGNTLTRMTGHALLIFG